MLPIPLPERMTWAVNAASPATLVPSDVAFGASGFDLTVEYLPTWAGSNYTREPTYTIWAMGDHALTHDSERLRLTVAGSERLVADASATMSGTPAGRTVQVRSWYRTLSGECGIAMAVGGAFNRTSTTAASSNLTMGSGTLTVGDATPVTIQRVIARRPDTPLMFYPEGVVIGDSTSAANVNLGTHNSIHAVAADLYPDLLRQSGWQIQTISTYADTISGQTSKWTALNASTRRNLRWVIVQIGINDITQNIDASDAAMIGRLQTLVNQIKADSPNATVFAATMTPASAMWQVSYPAQAATYTARWEAVNNAIRTGAIAGVTAISAHTDTLSAGYPGNSYYGSDTVHPLPSGRTVIRNAWYAALLSNNLI